MSRGVIVLYFCAHRTAHFLLHLNLDNGHVGETEFFVNTPEWVLATSPAGCRSIHSENPAQTIVWVNDGAEQWAHTFFDSVDDMEDEIRIRLDYSDPKSIADILKRAALYPQHKKFATDMQSGKFPTHRHHMLVAAYTVAINHPVKVK